MNINHKTLKYKQAESNIIQSNIRLKNKTSYQGKIYSLNSRLVQYWQSSNICQNLIPIYIF